MPKTFRYIIGAASIICGVMAAFYSQASALNYNSLFLQLVLPLYALQLGLGFVSARKAKKTIKTIIVCVVALSSFFVLELAARVFF